MNRLYIVELPDGVNGAVSEIAGGGRVIVINSRLSVEVQAVKIAHEIGHIRLKHFQQAGKKLADVEREADEYAEKLVVKSDS